jgi:hypothetical protein
MRCQGACNLKVTSHRGNSDSKQNSGFNRASDGSEGLKDALRRLFFRYTAAMLAGGIVGTAAELALVEQMGEIRVA